MIRYSIWLLTFFSCNFYVILSLVWRVGKKHIPEIYKHVGWLIQIFKFLFFTQGFWFFLIRVIEKSFRDVWVQNMKRLFKKGGYLALKILREQEQTEMIE